MSKIGLALALALVSGLPASGAQARCADVKVPLRNLKIVAKWQEKSVAIGDAATLKVHVTRTADEDPVTDEGVPYPTGRPMAEPVEGVVLGLGLYVGNVYLTAGGSTDAKGRAEVEIEIQSHTEPGTGETSVYGEKFHTPPDFPSSSCRVVIYEYGHLEPGPKIKVVP